LAELRCYSDKSSQALHIGPTITGLTLFSSGDLECQPLFLRVVRKIDVDILLRLAPELAQVLMLAPELTQTLTLSPELIETLRLAPELQQVLTADPEAANIVIVPIDC